MSLLLQCLYNLCADNASERFFIIFSIKAVIVLCAYAPTSVRRSISFVCFFLFKVITMVICLFMFRHYDCYTFSFSFIMYQMVRLAHNSKREMDFLFGLRF